MLHWSNNMYRNLASELGGGMALRLLKQPGWMWLAPVTQWPPTGYLMYPFVMFPSAISKGAARTAAVAAALAIEDKTRSYPPRGGIAVSCFAVEGGRFHPTAEEKLHRLADLARDRLTERGIRPGAMFRRWRHLLQATLARSVAAALLAAAAGPSDSLAASDMEDPEE